MTETHINTNTILEMAGRLLQTGIRLQKLRIFALAKPESPGIRGAPSVQATARHRTAARFLAAERYREEWKRVVCVSESGAGWIIFTEDLGVMSRLFAWLDRTPPIATIIVEHSCISFVSEQEKTNPSDCDDINDDPARVRRSSATNCREAYVW